MTNNEQLRSSVMPTKKEFPGGFNDLTPMMCHITKQEARTWDAMQGGSQWGEELPLRDYTKLGELVKSEEFRKFYFAALEEEMDAPPIKSPEFENDYLKGMEIIDNTPWEDAPADSLPEIKEMTESGIGRTTNKDSLMAYLPANFVYLLGIERGEVSINAQTGLPQFGGNPIKDVIDIPGKVLKETGRALKSNPVREAIRVGATVVGAVAGGPFGAMAGSVAGSLLTGRRNPMDIGMQAIKGGALAGVAGMGANFMGATNVGNALNNGVGFGGLGSMMKTGAFPAAPAAQMGAASLAAPIQSGGAAAGAAAAPSGGFLSSLTDKLPSGTGSALLGGAGLMGLGHILTPFADRQRHNQDRREQEEAYNRMKEREEQELHNSGFYKGIDKTTRKRIVNPDFGTKPGADPFIYVGGDERDDRYGKYNEGGDVKGKFIPQGKGEYISIKEDEEPVYGALPLRKGLLIDGVGGGQDDLMHTDIPETSFIVPADVLSMIGDGSSDAGAESLKSEIDDAMANMDHRHVAHVMEESTKNKIVPVALSRGEAPVSPSSVAFLGGGDVGKGTRMLQNLIINIRKHKTGSGTKLPPKTLPLKHYMNGGSVAQA